MCLLKRPNLYFTRRACWFLLGALSLVLGLIGIFLPLLPTTPFLILASACFMRASPRIHTWLVSHPYLGPPIFEWQEQRTIKSSIKKKAVIMIILSFTLSIIITPIVWIKVLLVLCLLGLLYWFSNIPST